MICYRIAIRSDEEVAEGEYESEACGENELPPEVSVVVLSLLKLRENFFKQSMHAT